MPKELMPDEEYIELRRSKLQCQRCYYMMDVALPVMSPVTRANPSPREVTVEELQSFASAISMWQVDENDYRSFEQLVADRGLRITKEK